jgi:hypothetical protein
MEFVNFLYIVLSGKGRAFSPVKCHQDAFSSMGFCPLKMPIPGRRTVKKWLETRPKWDKNQYLRGKRGCLRFPVFTSFKSQLALGFLTASYKGNYGS